MDENVRATGTPETSGQISIPQAARSLGLDTFTFYTLIQRGRVPYDFAAGGEIVVSEHDVKRMASKG
jgi:predicted DNA-binding transcriptional regulator AlpA